MKICNFLMFWHSFLFVFISDTKIIKHLSNIFLFLFQGLGVNSPWACEYRKISKYLKKKKKRFNKEGIPKDSCGPGQQSKLSTAEASFQTEKMQNWQRFTTLLSF